MCQTEAQKLGVLPQCLGLVLGIAGGDKLHGKGAARALPQQRGDPAEVARLRGNGARRAIQPGRRIPAGIDPLAASQRQHTRGLNSTETAQQRHPVLLADQKPQAVAEVHPAPCQLVDERHKALFDHGLLLIHAPHDQIQLDPAGLVGRRQVEQFNRGLVRRGHAPKVREDAAAERSHLLQRLLGVGMDLHVLGYCGDLRHSHAGTGPAGHPCQLDHRIPPLR